MIGPREAVKIGRAISDLVTQFGDITVDLRKCAKDVVQNWYGLAHEIKARGPLKSFKKAKKEK